MESAPFIVNIVDSVKSNTARIEGLEANVEAINRNVIAIKEGIKRQMKIEATVRFLCAALNAVSFGVGGSILDASINALGSIVDYSDLIHIQEIADQWGEGCIEQVRDGVLLAADEYAEKLIHKAVKDGHTLTVVSATAAMINMRCSTSGDNSIHLPIVEEAARSDVSENPLELSQRDNEEKFLTNDRAYEEVMQWLLAYLPRLQEDDAKKYCEHLMEDGFDSIDVLGGVREDDLDFMKKGHKRMLIERLGGKTAAKALSDPTVCRNKI